LRDYTRRFDSELDFNIISFFEFKPNYKLLMQDCITDAKQKISKTIRNRFVEFGLKFDDVLVNVKVCLTKFYAENYCKNSYKSFESYKGVDCEF